MGWPCFQCPLDGELWLVEQSVAGDLILADRGFTNEESAGMYCAQVKLPPFTKGKKQLSKLEVDTSRQLSSVRIHIERALKF